MRFGDAMKKKVTREQPTLHLDKEVQTKNSKQKMKRQVHHVKAAVPAPHVLHC